MTTQIETGTVVEGSLRNVSVDRLACLVRHWTWADEAMARFEQELARGWDYDEDLVADHPFGSYYHWCALLCGFSEAALEHCKSVFIETDAAAGAGSCGGRHADCPIEERAVAAVESRGLRTIPAPDGQTKLRSILHLLPMPRA